MRREKLELDEENARLKVRSAPFPWVNSAYPLALCSTGKEHALGARVHQPFDGG